MIVSCGERHARSDAPYPIILMSLIPSLRGGHLWLPLNGPSVAVAALLFAIRQSPAQPIHEMPGNISLQCDIRYRQGASEAWKLDLAYPKNPGTKLRPALVVIHGGGWIEGDKSSFTSLKHWAPGNIIDFCETRFCSGVT